MQSIHGRRESILGKKLEKTLLAVYLLFCFYKKQPLIQLAFEKQQTYANLLWRMMLAYDTPTRRVMSCLPASARVRMLIQ